MPERDFSDKSKPTLREQAEAHFGKQIDDTQQVEEKKPEYKPTRAPVDTNQDFLFQTPTKEVILPSGGAGLYPQIPEGKVTIKPIEQREIDILNTDHLVQKNLAFDKAIDSCIMSPKISTNMLISGDKVFLLFKIFELSKGTSKYEFTQICPSCRNKNMSEVDFDNIKTTRIELEKNEFVIEELPICKRSITYHLLTGNERSEIDQKIRVIMNSTTASKLIDSTSTEVMNASIDEVSGVPAEYKKEFVKKLIYGDAVYIKEHMNKNTPGMNPVYMFDCVHCEYSGEILIPITSEFFSMKI